MEDRWHSRGYLPHLDVEQGIQFVTWRIIDSLPIAVLQALETESLSLPEPTRNNFVRKAVDRYLDMNDHDAILRNPIAARIVTESIVRLHQKAYDLMTFVVMPNHCHILVQMHEQVALATAIHDIKGRSARLINQALGLSGKVWQREYFDRLIRTEYHLVRTAEYIERNPVKAGLCLEPKDWPWSGAKGPGYWQRFRDEVLDGAGLPDKSGGPGHAG